MRFLRFGFEGDRKLQHDIASSPYPAIILWFSCFVKSFHTSGSRCVEKRLRVCWLRPLQCADPDYFYDKFECQNPEHLSKVDCWEMKHFFLAMFVSWFTQGSYEDDSYHKTVERICGKRILPISCNTTSFWDHLLQECRVLEIETHCDWRFGLFEYNWNPRDASLKQRLLRLAKLPPFGLWILNTFFLFARFQGLQTKHLRWHPCRWCQGLVATELQLEVSVGSSGHFWVKKVMGMCRLFISYCSCISSPVMSFVYICQWFLRGESQDI